MLTIQTTSLQLFPLQTIKIKTKKTKTEKKMASDRLATILDNLTSYIKSTRAQTDSSKIHRRPFLGVKTAEFGIDVTIGLSGVWSWSTES